MRKDAEGVVIKPRLLDEREPTNEVLWDKMLQLARGDIRRYDVGGKVFHAPRNGVGFRTWPSPRAVGWAARQYNLAGGKWRPRKEETMEERVARRHLAALHEE